MALLPKKIGSVTLMRPVRIDGVQTAYAGILDDPPGKPCVVRPIPETLLRDPARARSIASRIGDLMPIRSPLLLGVLDHLHTEEGQYLVSQWEDAIPLADVVDWCILNDAVVPHNLFLHIATHACNALEALHGRPGAATGCKAVLHLALDTHALRITRDGKIVLGGFGLVPSPTNSAHSGGFKIKRLYVSPEQTQLEQGLTPASDLFSLGAVLYEILTLKSMFSGSTPLRTIAMVRRAEVTTQLLEIKEVFPGLDRVMYRVLSQNPRHRYQRAFVLREDLRALMAGYSFSNIEADARSFLEPMFSGEQRTVEEIHSPLPFVAPDGETTLSLLDDSDGIEAPRLRVEELTDPGPPPMQVMPSLPPGTLRPRPSATPPPPAPASEPSTDAGTNGPATGAAAADTVDPAPPEPGAAPEAADPPRPVAASAPQAAGSMQSSLPLFLAVAALTAFVVGCAGISIVAGTFGTG